VQAQGYKGIIPIGSTCKDVEKTLKVKSCSSSKVEYETKNESVKIYFSNIKREKLFQKSWDVPVGTVIGVIIDLKEPLPAITDFCLNMNDFEKSSNDTDDFYSNKEKGIQIQTVDNYVRGIWYLPPENNKLLCK
jgi:hypothetical protein